MLPGFPKKVTQTKLERGRYRLTREDGYTVDIVRGVNGWWANSRKVKSLGMEVYDMKHGFTAMDQLEHEEKKRQENS